MCRLLRGNFGILRMWIINDDCLYIVDAILYRFGSFESNLRFKVPTLTPHQQLKDSWCRQCLPNSHLKQAEWSGNHYRWQSRVVNQNSSEPHYCHTKLVPPDYYFSFLSYHPWAIKSYSASQQSIMSNNPGITPWTSLPKWLTTVFFHGSWCL